VHLDEIDFDLENTDSDVLGDAYEYLIGQFASGAGKKAGEFYTPQQVSSVLAQIVTAGKDQLKSVYDPTCGSGSLLRVAKEVKTSVLLRSGDEPYHVQLVSHEHDYARCALQAFRYQERRHLRATINLDMRFEAIVANPFSANWSASPLFMNDDRFSGMETRSI
jgi:type I restriction enzyme M protein